MLRKKAGHLEGFIILLGVVIISGFACTILNPQPADETSAPVILVKPDSLSFTLQSGKGNTGEQDISVTNAGGGILTWSMSDDSRWIYLQRPEGATATPDSIKVRVDIAGIAPGDYTGSITIAAEGATNSPFYVPVHLSITPSELQQPGVIQQPAQTETSKQQPGSSAVVWKNQMDFMTYATTNACIVKGSVTNLDATWYMRDVKIVAKSGASASLSGVIPPGETIIYYKFIPCYERQALNLQYNWRLQ